MAERRAKKPPAAKPAAQLQGGSLSTMPADALRLRTAAFLRMTQGPGKPQSYPSPSKRP